MVLPSDLIAFPTITLGAFLEGEAVIIGSTVASTLGHFHTWTVLVSAFIGTILGDNLAYLVGRFVRHGSDRVVFGRRIVTEDALQLAERFYARHGGKTVFLLRFAYGMRTAGYFLAGASRLPYRRFFLADTAAALTWCATLVLLGLLVGKSILPYLEGWVGIAIGTTVVLVVASTLITVQRRFFRIHLPRSKS